MKNKEINHDSLKICLQRDLVNHDISGNFTRDIVDNSRRGIRTASDEASPLHTPVFTACAEAMLLFDPWEDRILDANPAAAHLLERPVTELLQTRVSALHPGQLPRLLVFTEEVLLRGQARTDTLALHHLDGTTRTVEYAASRIEVADRTLILAILYDLRARRLNCALREAQDYLRRGIGQWRDIEDFFRELERENRLILSAAGEGIYGVNAEGLTTFVNPAAERILGWRADEMVGRNMHDLIHHTHPDGAH